MIKEFVKAWDERKDELEAYFKAHKQSEYGSYTDLVKLLFEIVINPSISDRVEDESEDYGLYNTYDIDNVHEINDGDYQGTIIFLIPENTYQPNTSEYVYTSVYYGSCSCCDTLQSIHEYDWDATPTDDQVSRYMTLCLHILQNCHYLVPREE